MDQEDSKKIKQTNPDVNAVSRSESGKGNKDASGLPLKRQREKASPSTSTKKSKVSQGNRIPRCAFCGEYHAGGVLED